MSTPIHWKDNAQMNAYLSNPCPACGAPARQRCAWEGDIEAWTDNVHLVRTNLAPWPQLDTDEMEVLAKYLDIITGTSNRDIHAIAAYDPTGVHEEVVYARFQMTMELHAAGLLK